MSLIVPNKIHNSHNNSDTYKVYDPNEAIGDTSPTAAKPPKKNKCGAFGQILMVAIAVAVTLIALPGAAPTLLQGALAGAAGSVASQGVGLITGIQDKFSFKGMALAALSGGVGAGLGGVNAFGKAATGFGKIGNAMVRGALGSALVQGVGVATDLQSSFDWAGVAAAGVGAGVGSTIGGHTALGRAGAGMAGGLAGAAATSLVTGRNFGDTIMSQLPSIIGNTIGNLVAEQVAGDGQRRTIAQTGDTQNNPTVADNIDTAGTGNSAAREAVGDIVVTAYSLSSSRIFQSFLFPGQPTEGTVDSTWNGAYLSSYVDDHRYAVSDGELDSWRQRFEQFLVDNPGKFAEADIARYRAGFEENQRLLAIGTAMADAEMNKLLFAGIGAPALLAGGAVAIPLAAGYAGSFYVGGTASTLASGGAGFVTGGTLGAGFEFSKNRAFGLPDTAGGYTTAILGGGLGGTGLRLLPNNVLGRAVSVRAQTVALGAFSGGAGDISGQLVANDGDYLQINYGQAGLATGLGGGLGAVTPLEVRSTVLGTAGRNSSLSIYQGLNTRLNSGNITQMQLRYGVNAGAAGAFKGAGQQAVGTIVDGVLLRVGN